MLYFFASRNFTMFMLQVTERFQFDSVKEGCGYIIVIIIIVTFIQRHYAEALVYVRNCCQRIRDSPPTARNPFHVPACSLLCKTLTWKIEFSFFPCFSWFAFLLLFLSIFSRPHLFVKSNKRSGNQCKISVNFSSLTSNCV